MEADLESRKSGLVKGTIWQLELAFGGKMGEEKMLNKQILLEQV